MNPTERIVRKPEAKLITGLSESTMRRMELAGTFPRRRVLSANSVGYCISELTEWVSSRKVRQ